MLLPSDMINKFDVDFAPQTAAWIHPRGQGKSVLAM